jgi:aminoglycoside phosphotransferase (APT) family kinase protein
MSTTHQIAPDDIVRTPEEAGDRDPLVVVEPLVAFLDQHDLGSGEPEFAPIGEGHSNVTYDVRRGDARFVLRRPPRGPLPPSAHDMLREARVLTALHGHARVPEVLAVCEDPGVIGAPFYVMDYVDGHVMTNELPPALAGDGAGARIGEELVDALVELHAVDVAGAGLGDFGRPSGYLDRQVRRFTGLLEHNATRPLPDLEAVADWLSGSVPESPAATVVHGDYRLGNVMFGPQGPPRLVSVLDWELAALGDPLADVGYLTVTWAEPGDPPNPMLDLSGVTRQPGFLDRAALVRRYEERSGRALDALAWYQVLALWKAAIFLEGSYKRFRAGTTDDAYFAVLGEGVPALARLARARAEGG